MTGMGCSAAYLAGYQAPCRKLGRNPSSNLHNARSQITVHKATTCQWETKWNEFWKACQFESWAPRSSRAWRLREIPTEVELKGDATSALNVPVSTPRLKAETGMDWKGVEAGGSMADSELSACLHRRLAAMQNADGDNKPVAPESQVPVFVSTLTGKELAQICYNKYGRFHDMAIRHVTINRGKTQRWVSLNLYVGFYGQKSFPYNEEEYLEKLDAIAVMINAWQQADYIREFFKERIYPKRGLPSRPRVDTAISIRLNQSPTWNNALAEDWFTY